MLVSTLIEVEQELRPVVILAPATVCDILFEYYNSAEAGGHYCSTIDSRHDKATTGKVLEQQKTTAGEITATKVDPRRTDSLAEVERRFSMAEFLPRGADFTRRIQY